MFQTIAVVYGLVNNATVSGNPTNAMNGWKELLDGHLPVPHWWQTNANPMPVNGSLECARAMYQVSATSKYMVQYDARCPTTPLFAAMGHVLLHAANATPTTSSLFYNVLPPYPVLTLADVNQISQTFGPALLCNNGVCLRDKTCGEVSRLGHVHAPNVCKPHVQSRASQVNRGLLIAYLFGMICVVMLVSACVFNAVCPNEPPTIEGESYATDEHLLQPETPPSLLRITDPTIIVSECV
jgi:hypothetical protein